MTTDTQQRTVASRRRALGMNQAQLAMEAGCSIQSIHNIEQGPGPKRSRVLEQVEAVLAQKEAEL